MRSVSYVVLQIKTTSWTTEAVVHLPADSSSVCCYASSAPLRYSHRYGLLKRAEDTCKMFCVGLEWELEETEEEGMEEVFGSSVHQSIPFLQTRYLTNTLIETAAWTH